MQYAHIWGAVLRIQLSVILAVMALPWVNPSMALDSPLANILKDAIGMFQEPHGRGIRLHGHISGLRPALGSGRQGLQD
jgi:hypothetical protein